MRSRLDTIIHYAHLLPHVRKLLLLTAAVFLCSVGMAQAQQSNLALSSNADFSTLDQRFQAEDTLNIQLTVDTNRVNVLAVEKAQYTFESEGTDEEVSGTLENNFDGTFTASVPASQLEGSRAWQLETEVEDENDAEVEASAFVNIISDVTQETFALQGQVSQASSSEITVSGQTVQINQSTQITNYAGETVEASTLTDQQVLVTTRPQDTGDPVAVRVLVRDETFAELEIKEAQVSSVQEGGSDQPDTVAVSGLTEITIVADESTTIRGQGGAVVTTSDLANAEVEIDARRQGDVWLATRIHVEEEPEETEDDGGEDLELEVEGAVESTTETSLTIGGITFDAQEADFEGGIDGLAGLSTGDLVSVEFTSATDGTFSAETVDLEDEPETDEVEASGAITAVTSNSVTVSNTTFEVTDTTTIEGEEEELSLTVDQLYTGLEVEVEGRLAADGSGSLVADVIEIDQELEKEFEFKGQISSVTDTSFVVSETNVVVSDTLVIEGEEGASLTLADLQANMWTEVEGTVQLGGTYVAEKVEVENRFEENDVEVTGTIESASSSEISLNGFTFTINDQTEIEDQNEQTITASELSTGQIVEVDGHLTADGSAFVAEEIKVEDEIHHEGEIEGAVTATSGDTLTVAGISFRLVNRSILAGNISAIADLQGQRVDVDFRMMPDTTRIALKVEAEDSDDTGVELSGLINSVDASALVVAGVTVNTTASTSITGLDGNTIAITDLTAGTEVEITGSAAADGSIEAESIEAEQAAVVSGRVKQRTSANDTLTVEVANKTVDITNETLIIGENNANLTLEDIQQDSYIQVRAVSQASGTAGKMLAAEGDYTAKRVRVQQTETGTAVEEPTQLPTAFSLEQNYPNPFNPTTTVQYTASTAGHLTITVFDALGRKVDVLVDRKHAAGTHTIQFNAQGLPSGLYFYRLQAPGVVQTRQMMLVK